MGLNLSSRDFLNRYIDYFLVAMAGPKPTQNSIVLTIMLYKIRINPIMDKKNPTQINKSKQKKYLFPY